ALVLLEGRCPIERKRDRRGGWMAWGVDQEGSLTIGGDGIRIVVRVVRAKCDVDQRLGRTRSGTWGELEGRRHGGSGTIRCAACDVKEVPAICSPQRTNAPVPRHFPARAGTRSGLYVDFVEAALIRRVGQPFSVR